jgi:hypothetical protein
MLLVGSAAWFAASLLVADVAHAGVSLWTAWNLLAASLLAAASVGIVRRGVLPQIFARGVAWWVIALALPPWSDSMGWLSLRLVTALLAIAALHLTAPNLETESYRKVFLAGAAAAVAIGLSSGLGALWEAARVLEGRSSGEPGEVWGPALLAVSYVTSAIGVVRMRAWGVLLGVGTAIGSVACALPVLPQVSWSGLACVCVPGALLGAPLVAARLAERATPRLRVAEVPAAAEQEQGEADVRAERPSLRCGR